MANVKAYDPGFISGAGKVMRRTDSPMTIERADQNGILVHWQGSWWSKDGGTHYISHEATIYLTAKTVFSGGYSSERREGCCCACSLSF
jgi:hypothetical protein